MRKNYFLSVLSYWTMNDHAAAAAAGWNRKLYFLRPTKSNDGSLNTQLNSTHTCIQYHYLRTINKSTEIAYILTVS